jgi:hypothetical protein
MDEKAKSQQCGEAVTHSTHLTTPIPGNLKVTVRTLFLIFQS